MDLDKLYKEWAATKDQQANKRFVEKAKPLLNMAVKTYVGTPSPAAYANAKILAVKALQKYDPAKKVRLRNYLLTQLQPLRRFAAKQQFVLHTPERVRQDLAHIEEVTKQLRDDLGMEPDLAAIADKTGYSIARLRKLEQYRRQMIPESAFETEESDYTGPGTISENDPWVDYVYHDLSPMDRKIFEYRTGYNGQRKLSTNAIARKLGLTPAAVSQRVNKIVEKLNQYRGVI